MDTMEKIEWCIAQVQDVFALASGPNNRNAYMRQCKIRKHNWHFGLSADDIITLGIPTNVCGCTGRARLFCYFAAQIGLDCRVAVMALAQDWFGARELARLGIPNRSAISGHQVPIVEIDGVFTAIEPHIWPLTTVFRYKDLPKSGTVIGRYIYTACLTPVEYDDMQNYGQLHNLYASGDINNPDFVLEISAQN